MDNYDRRFIAILLLGAYFIALIAAINAFQAKQEINKLLHNGIEKCIK